jgi:hypothetical protein
MEDDCTPAKIFWFGTRVQHNNGILGLRVKPSAVQLEAEQTKGQAITPGQGQGVAENNKHDRYIAMTDYNMKYIHESQPLYFTRFKT